MKVTVVARSGPLWSGESNSVVFPSQEGEIGVLPRHTPMMALLQAGTVRIETSDGSTKSIEVNDGFVTVDQDNVYIVSEL